MKILSVNSYNERNYFPHMKNIFLSDAEKQIHSALAYHKNILTFKNEPYFVLRGQKEEYG